MLPYLRLYMPQLSVEKKRVLAREITEALTEALHLPMPIGEWCTIHFIPLRSEDIAVGGQLACDGAEPSYLIEITDREFTAETKESVVEELRPIFMRHLGLRRDQVFDLNFRFYVCEAKDFAIGGRFLSEYHERQAVAAPIGMRRL